MIDSAWNMYSPKPTVLCLEIEDWIQEQFFPDYGESAELTFVLPAHALTQDVNKLQSLRQSSNKNCYKEEITRKTRYECLYIHARPYERLRPGYPYYSFYLPYSLLSVKLE